MGARELLAELAGAGLSVTAGLDGGTLLISPKSLMTDAIRVRLRAAKPELLALLTTPAAPGPDADRARFVARRDRLLCWGWPEPEAQALAERLARRDADDDRRTCAECRNYRPGRCGNHRAAGLSTPEIGRDLASLPQRCRAYRSES